MRVPQRSALRFGGCVLTSSVIRTNNCMDAFVRDPAGPVFLHTWVRTAASLASVLPQIPGMLRVDAAGAYSDS